MTGFILKIIGMITMIFDHWGYIVGGPEILRILGRISFPLFSFLTVEGYRYTKSRKDYLKRILSFGLIMQIAYTIFYGFDILNIFITLSFGIINLILWDKFDGVKRIILLVLVGVLSQTIKVDYGIFGIYLPLLFYKVGLKNPLFYLIYGILIEGGLRLEVVPRWQYYSFLALPIIALYNGKEGKKLRYFFYLFYPIHLIVIQGMAMLLKK